MSVINFEQTRRIPYAGGTSFSDVGPYEQIDGILTFGVDPGAPANREIVDLGLVDRDENGLVQFKADFSITRPVDPELGSHTLLIELPNRGRRRIIDTLNMTGADASNSPPPGDGFLFERGYSIASIGWQWDVFKDDILMGLDAPLANISGEIDPGQAVVEIRPYQRARTWLLADRIHKPLRASDLNDPEASLLVKDYEDGEVELVPRDRWRFAKESPGGVEPSNEHIYLEEGFEPGKYYQVLYRTDDAPVAGAGLIAFRDVATFLRNESDQFSLGLGRIDNVIGYGVSQTGRFIRHFLHLGLNVDENGQTAYDGLLPHVAGARMGSFNNRYAQPSNQSYPSWGHMFPFADAERDDPLSGRRDGLLARLHKEGAVPKIVYTNSSAEYWRGDCSLMTTDPLGTIDIELDPGTRVYHFAGTQHGPGTLPQTAEGAPEGALGAHPFGVVDYSPLLRAALVNLVDWVANDTEPPGSMYPNIADGTAITRQEVLETFNHLPDQAVPNPQKLWVIRTIDLGQRAQEGVGTYPPVEGKAYACLVSSVDADGNELGGIRLPDISVPVATHAGWNTRANETGSPDQQIPMQGFTRWFSATERDREQRTDPRPSIEERYESRDEYERLVREEVGWLIRDRFVLESDLELVVNNAMERYDYALDQAGRATAVKAV